MYFSDGQTIQRPNKKKTKGPVMVESILHRMQKIELHEWGRTQIILMDKQFLLLLWNPSCYTCYKPGY